MFGIFQDSTLPLLANGYAWLPDARRRADGQVLRTRLMGRQAVALHGPEAVAFFYDEDHVRRRAALPEPVLDTLFGRGAVHTLDGQAHRVRKAMFVSLLTDQGGVAALARQAVQEWTGVASQWDDREVVLFEEAALILSRAVCAWTGVHLPDERMRQLAQDCVAMVDGFATAGPRHWRARAARTRQEKVLATLVERTREASRADDDQEPSPLTVVARHRDADGTLLDPHTAAVEVLNIIRPTIAISWFITFAAHALHRWPDNRDRLRQHNATAFAEAFAHEVRRFYPFAPFIGGLAARDLQWHGERIPQGSMVLLDIYGQNHDPALWPDPYRFSPERFLNRPPRRDEFVPPGGGDTRKGHRCPGEDITIALLAALSTELARLDYTVPDQDLTIPLNRIPTRPRSGFLLKNTAQHADALVRS